MVCIGGESQVMNAQAQMQPGVEGPVGGRSLWLECKRGDDAPYFYNPMTQQSVVGKKQSLFRRDVWGGDFCVWCDAALCS